MSKKQHLEEMFAAQLDERGVPYERELMLIPGRALSLGLCCPHGRPGHRGKRGTWMGGRGGHSSGSGIQRDLRES